MKLIDTSVWIEYFRDSQSRACNYLAELLRTDASQVAICEPIAMEVLAGAPQQHLAKLERLVSGLPCLRVEPTVDYYAAAQLFRDARRAGFTIRALNDCLICAIAIRTEAELVHRDTDFETLAAMTGLRQLSLR